MKIESYSDIHTKQTESVDIEIINPIGIGINLTKIVRLSNGKIGYLKNSALTTDKTLDDIEYFMSIAGKYILKMDFAKVYRVYDDNNFIGIISEEVAKENEQFMMFSTLVANLVNAKKNILQTIIFKYQQLRNKNNYITTNINNEITTYPFLEDEEDICAAIDMFLIVLEYLDINEDAKKDMRNNYFKMLIFDVLMNHKDRNDNNYGVIYNEKTGNIRFSPLFDNSTIYMPDIPENLCQINRFFMDKKQMMSILITRYNEYTEPFISEIETKQDEIIQKCEYVATNVLTPAQQDLIMSIIKENIKELTIKSKRK